MVCNRVRITFTWGCNTEKTHLPESKLVLEPYVNQCTDNEALSMVILSAGRSGNGGRPYHTRENEYNRDDGVSDLKVQGIST